MIQFEVCIQQHSAGGRNPTYLLFRRVKFVMISSFFLKNWILKDLSHVKIWKQPLTTMREFIDSVPDTWWTGFATTQVKTLMRFGADPSCLENKTFEDAEEQKLVEWTKQLGKEDHP